MRDFAAIQSLLSNQVPESEIIDYKRDCYGRNDADKRELLKDVSSFANSRGGHIIIGVDERAGVPTEIIGINATVDIDAEIQFMVQVINSGFDPASTSVQVRPVVSDDGIRCLVMDIPRSSIAPHRIAFGKYHKFFVRDSNGKHEATMPELKNLFTIGELGRNRFREFCRERVDTILDPDRDTTRIFTKCGILTCHIVPQVCLLTDQLLDINALYENNHALLSPFGNTGSSPRYNFDGFIIFSSSDRVDSYTQLFRHGVVEAVMGNVHQHTEDYGETIFGIPLEEKFFNAFDKYLQAYAKINIPPPFIVQVTLAGVRDACYYRGNNIFKSDQSRLDRDRLFLHECTIESVESPAHIHKGIKPAFDSLYNALGQPSCPNFSKEGLWKRR